VEKKFNNIFKDIPTYSRFLTVNEIDNLSNLITKLPSVTHKTIGKTINDEPFEMLEVGKGDKTGNPIPQEITSCETGRTERVRTFGRRVKGGDRRTVEEVRRDMRNRKKYDSSTPLIKRVIRDKLDNGVVDNNVVGKKERGYLTEEITMEGFEDKYITRW